MKVAMRPSSRRRWLLAQARAHYELSSSLALEEV